MQFVAHNVTKVELDSTSATQEVTRNVARKITPCFLDFYLIFTFIRHSVCPRARGQRYQIFEQTDVVVYPATAFFLPGWQELSKAQGGR